MPRLVTDITPRYCSRCRSELTDPASRECGVGPVCRNRDNHLYAKAIEANLPIAGALVLGTHAEQLPPELCERFENFKTSFLKKMEKVQKSNEALAMKVAGADFRDEVRELDYFLSYMMTDTLRDRLIKIVESLGYVGLAGVLSGDASKSSAKVWFEDGRVWLAGTSSTTGFFQMKKIPGITTPRYRGDKTPYSAPVAEADAFFEVVRKFWPLYDADLDALKAQIVAWKAQNPQNIMQMAQTVAPPQMKETARIVMRLDDFTLTFPWKKGANMYTLVNGLKEIPYRDRKYDPESKSWSFKMEYLAHVRRYVEKIFDDAVESESNEATPAGLYNAPKKSAGARRGRRKYRHRY